MGNWNRKRQELRKHRLRNILLNAVCVLLAGSGLWATADYFWRHVNYVVTNDAFVDQYVAPLNIRVAGYVREVRFTEHRFVREGDTLLILDDREYRIPGEGGRSRAARRPRHAGSDPFGHRDLAHERRGAGGQHRRSPGETLADGAGFPSFRTAAARRIGSGTAVRAGQSRLRSRGGPLSGARGAEGGQPVAVRRSQQTDGRRRSQHTPPARPIWTWRA